MPDHRASFKISDFLFQRSNKLIPEGIKSRLFTNLLIKILDAVESAERPDQMIGALLYGNWKIVTSDKTSPSNE